MKFLQLLHLTTTFVTIQSQGSEHKNVGWAKQRVPTISPIKSQPLH